MLRSTVQVGERNPDYQYLYTVWLYYLLKEINLLKQWLQKKKF